MVVAGKRRVLSEYRAVLRIFDVVLDRHQPFLAYLGQNLEEHRQQIDVQHLGKLRALEDPGQGSYCRLDDTDVVGCHEPADCQADDRHVFERHPQRGQAPMHRIGPQRGCQNDHVPNNQKHPTPLVISRGKCIADLGSSLSRIVARLRTTDRMRLPPQHESDKLAG